MSYKLPPDEKCQVGYSKAERRVWEVLSSGDQMPTTKLVSQYYNGEVPLNGQVCVMNVVRKLMKKLEINKSPNCIHRSESSGRIPMIIWVE